MITQSNNNGDIKQQQHQITTQSNNNGDIKQQHNRITTASNNSDLREPILGSHFVFENKNKKLTFLMKSQSQVAFSSPPNLVWIIVRLGLF